MIAEFVKLVDDELHGLVDQIKSFGLSVLRIDKEDGRRVPMVLSFDGKEINATISDVYKVSTYHRLISSTITLGDNESGYGHELNQSINNYNMALFVYFKRDKVKLYPDELSILFQSEMNFFKKVNIGDDFLGDLQASTQSASFEEETIWRQEYNTKFDLDPRDSLFQINYQFQLTTERKCIHKICKIC